MAGLGRIAKKHRRQKASKVVVALAALTGHALPATPSMKHWRSLGALSVVCFQRFGVQVAMARMFWIGPCTRSAGRLGMTHSSHAVMGCVGIAAPSGVAVRQSMAVAVRRAGGVVCAFVACFRLSPSRLAASVAKRMPFGAGVVTNKHFWNSLCASGAIHFLTRPFPQHSYTHQLGMWHLLRLPCVRMVCVGVAARLHVHYTEVNARGVVKHVGTTGDVRRVEILRSMAPRHALFVATMPCGAVVAFIQKFF